MCVYGKAINDHIQSRRRANRRIKAAEKNPRERFVLLFDDKKKIYWLKTDLAAALLSCARASEMRFGLKNCQTQQQVVNPFINFVFIDQSRTWKLMTNRCRAHLHPRSLPREKPKCFFVNDQIFHSRQKSTTIKRMIKNVRSLWNKN